METKSGQQMLTPDTEELLDGCLTGCAKGCGTALGAGIGILIAIFAIKHVLPWL